MILRLATANENGRGTGVPPVKSEDQTSMPRLDSLVPLGSHQVHKMVRVRPRGMVDKREMEQAQLF